MNDHKPPVSSPADQRAAPRLPPGCTLRLLRETDLEAYKALRDAMLNAHDEAFTSDAASERQRSADSYRSRLTLGGGGTNLFTIAAWAGPDLVGAVSCEREPRAKVRHTAHIVGMMVLDSLQGRGIGRALLHSALRMLETEDGIELVTLSVSSVNTGAVKLYESLGFARYGRLPGALKLADGRRLDKDLMYRALTPAGAPR